jgi:hypothetical protein
LFAFRQTCTQPTRAERSLESVERTLRTSGVLDAAMESHHARGNRIETPKLEVRYTAPADSGYCHGSITPPI